MSAIEEAVIYESHRGGNYSGISIFLPDDKKYYRSSYEDLDFAQQTQA